MDAARKGDTVTVRTLLSTSATASFINFQDEKGGTPLHTVTHHGHASVTEELLASHCNVDIQDMDGFTALHLTALVGHKAVTTKL